MNPTISVIIATYYRNDLVRDAIESVLEQDYEPLEIVVVDDSGEGHAEDVIAEYDDVTGIIRSENGGWAAAYSTGIQATTGSYVQMLDDDDYLLDGKLAKTAAILGEHPDVGVAYCGLVQDTLGPVRPDPAVSGDILEHALRFRTFPLCTITMLIEREVLEKTLPLARFADDLNLKIELARRTRFAYVDECLVYRREVEGRRWQGMNRINEMKGVLRNQQALYERYPAIKRAALAETYAREGQIRLDDRLWSTKAIACFAKATYYADEYRLLHGGRLTGSILGRPGLDTMRRLHGLTPSWKCASR